MTVPAPLYGTMRGEVVTVWLHEKQQVRRRGFTFWRRESRRMRLHAETTLVYERSDGEPIPALIGLEFDGGSIPVLLWWLIGSPFTGAAREAYVIHDTLCKVRDRPSAEAHRIMYEAARALGTARWRAAFLYRGLLIGGSKWPWPSTDSPSLIGGSKWA